MCDYHGGEIDVVWKDYYKYKDDLYACKKCRQAKTSTKNLHQRQKSLYERAMEFCNQYGYSLDCDVEDIKNSNTRVNYICPKHGKHNVKIYNLISGHCCVDCKHEENADKHRHNPDFIESEFIKYGSLLLNKEEYVNSTEKNLRALCPDCGGEFVTSYYSFVKHDGLRCPECTRSESAGEYAVRMYLEQHKYNYIPQFRFVNCKYKNTLPFDFYIPDLNVTIEFDGAQHFHPVKRGDMTDADVLNAFKEIQKRDLIKTKYCIDNNIKLIRIPYWELKNIESILDNKLNK